MFSNHKRQRNSVDQKRKLDKSKNHFSGCPTPLKILRVGGLENFLISEMGGILGPSAKCKQKKKKKKKKESWGVWF